MDEYQKDILIDELQKLVVSKSLEVRIKDFEIKDLKATIECLENQLKPTTHGVEENKK